MRTETHLSIFEAQCCIIRAQEDIIDELLGLLMQHISVDEAAEIENRIETTTKMKERIGK